MMLIGGNQSESIIPPNSKLLVLIIDSVAIALVIPEDGNPLMTTPPSILIGLISLISSRYPSLFNPKHQLKYFR